MPKFLFLFLSWWTFGAFPLFLAIMSNASLSFLVQVFVQIYGFVYLGYILRSGTAGSFCNFV